jgi:hypothetical protein
MTISEQVRQYAGQGYTHTQIADAVGTSRQYVHQLLGTYGPNHFKRMTEKQIVYPNLRKWFNDNQMTYAEVIRRMGLQYHTKTVNRLKGWFTGRNHPDKKHIDILLTVTGLTYEQLFNRDGD